MPSTTRWSPPGHYPLTCPGVGAAGGPHSAALAPSALCYLLQSPPRRTPAAAGLQPQHGPAALPVAPGVDASPAASGKGSPCSVSPGVRLPSPTVPGHGCPVPSSLDFAFTTELFPGLPDMGRDKGLAMAVEALLQGQMLCPSACGKARRDRGTCQVLPHCLRLAELC